MLRGIDISRHNAKMLPNFNDYDFVIMKATEGRTYKDPYLDIYYDLLHGKKDGQPDNKKLYGFYHYARPENNDWESEAKNFLKAVGHHAGHCLFILDWEGKALKHNISWALKWLNYVYAMTGVKPLIYTQASYTDRLGCIAKNDYGLWVAHYNVKKPKTGAYKYYALWQFTDEPYDINYFNGTKEAFRKYCAVD